MSCILVKDIFDELKDENNRLVNELSFAKSIFADLKIFFDLISYEIKPNLNSKSKKLFKELTRKVSIIFGVKESQKKRTELTYSPPDCPPEDKTTNWRKNKRKVSLNEKSIDNKNTECQPTIESDAEVWDEPNIYSEESDEELEVNTNGRPNRRASQKKLKRDNDSDLCEDRASDASDYIPEEVRPKRRPKIRNINCEYSDCKRRFKSVSDLKRHIDYNHAKDKPFACDAPDCDFTAATHKILSEHFQMRHSGENPFVCPEVGCYKAYKVQASLNLHIRDHSKPREREGFRCDICNKWFESKKNLSRHKNRCHSTAAIPCTYPGCDYVGKHREVFDYHMKSKHSNGSKQLFVCTVEGCDKILTSELGFKIHVLRHSEPQFECYFEGCSQKFFEARALNHHIKIVHIQDKEYLCDWPGCEFKSFDKKSVQLHKMVHKDVYRFVCDRPDCSAKFKRSSNLQAHKSFVHDKVRKVPCSWPGCQFVAPTNTRLKEHERTHTNERPFACHWPECAYRSNKKWHLGQHLLKHEKKLNDK